VVKARLEYVIDATSQGIMNNAGGMLGGNGSVAGLPDTARQLPETDGKLIAKFVLEDDQSSLLWEREEQPLSILITSSLCILSEK
jgi:hypothetical protein